VEVFLPGSGGAQIHEPNPTQFPPVGLFWTVPIPASGVEVDLTSGTATMTARKVPVYDYLTLQNALSTGINPPPVPGWISFKVVWQGGVTMMPVTSTDPTKGASIGLMGLSISAVSMRIETAVRNDPECKDMTRSRANTRLCRQPPHIRLGTRPTA
jgi:hypothetical protein